MTCVRQSRRFTCASSCSNTMRSRSSGQRFASSGISTDGVKIPAAIGIEARALSRNLEPARDPQPGRELDRQPQPRRVNDTLGPARHPRDRGEPDRQASDNRNDSSRPDCEQNHRQRDLRRALHVRSRYGCTRRRDGSLERRFGGGGRIRCAAAERRCGSRSVVNDRRRWGRRRQCHERQLPARQRDREHRKDECARQRQRPHQVPDGGRCPSKEERDEAGEAQDQRGLEQSVDGRSATPRRAGSGKQSFLRLESWLRSAPTGFAIIRARRSSSTSDIFVEASSSRAEMACSAEPSKKVCSMCRMAERLALSRAMVGRNT